MFEEKDGKIYINLYVQPKSQKNEIIGEYNGRLKIKIRGLPADGEANKNIVNFFSKYLKTAKKNIEIVSGSTGRNKKIAILGLNLDEIKNKIL
ncbi:DUF167 domain-containing protein [Haliovirga abyssi]|uniref:UPF0235 protein HLVA_05620 n=1 Tax=Haliovirga abyssi TaxID=2996794 RepID=A0AAU9DNQ0_9FUSO|nr:DUF167 domain-containing protein [Haliovirga abyssi]BDU49993.1 UPF0235 protein [Haliovirga abyssi]